MNLDYKKYNKSAWNYLQKMSKRGSIKCTVCYYAHFRRIETNIREKEVTFK